MEDLYKACVTKENVFVVMVSLVQHVLSNLVLILVLIMVNVSRDNANAKKVSKEQTAQFQFVLMIALITEYAAEFHFINAHVTKASQATIAALENALIIVI